MPSFTQCGNCKDTVGAEAKVLAFHEREGEKLVATWCPQCFCYHRTMLGDRKYQLGMFIAIHCGRCGYDTIDRGPLGHCGNCGSRAVSVLKPKEHATTLLQEAKLAK